MTNNYFEMTIMFIIGLNMATMMLQHYGQSQDMSEVLDILLIRVEKTPGNCRRGGGEEIVEGTG